MDTPIPPWTSLPALQVERIPGEHGPILRCFGDLSEATLEPLRRNLALVMPLGHPALTLDLSGCGFIDVAGLMTLLHAFKQLQHEGRRLAVVAGTGSIARLLQATGVSRFVPTFPDQEAAALSLRGGAPAAPAPAPWTEARAETLAQWKAIQSTLDQAPPEEVLRQLTSMFALCDRSEEIFQESAAPATVRCQFCPLFYTLGGRPQDVGCRSVLDPLLEAVQAGDQDQAGALVTRMLLTLEQMPLPEEVPPPARSSAPLGAPAVRTTS